MSSRATTAALFAASALALGACGGGKTSTTASPASAPAGQQGPPQGGQRPQLSQDQQAQLAEGRKCLKKQGVTLPSNPQGAGSFDPQDPHVRAALRACQQYAPQLPSGAGPGGGTSQ